jgi:hypothetical protein
MLLIFNVPRSSAVEAYRFSLILLAARVRLAYRERYQWREIHPAAALGCYD